MAQTGATTPERDSNEIRRFKSSTPALEDFLHKQGPQDLQPAAEPGLITVDEQSHDLRNTVRDDDDEALFVPLVIDTDNTGTYDPKGRLRRKRRRIKPVRVSIAGGQNSSFQSSSWTRVEKLSQAAVRENGESLVITLSCNSDLFKVLTSRINDNWAEESWSIFEKDDISNDSEDSKLHKRTVENCTCNQNEAQPRIPDPCGEHPDLFGHPSARGCVACRLDNLTDPDALCSLLSPSSTYPCAECVEAKINCQLITPPSKRVNCDRCKRRKLACSYGELGSDPNAPCSLCQQAGAPCIAGPAPDGIRQRISYDVIREIVSCAACRRGKRACSLKTFDDAPPCKRCTLSGQRCTFEKLQAKARQTKARPEAAKHKQKDQCEDDMPTSISALDQDHLPGGAVMVNTSLEHPLYFVCPDKQACRWCQDPSYSIFDIRRRERLLIPNDLTARPASYSEVNPLAPKEVYPQASRMCIECTLDRLRIIQCTHGTPRALDERYMVVHDLETGQDELVKRKLDVDAMYRRLQSGTPQKDDIWCSLCPSPAFLRCCAPSTASPKIQRGRANGCGMVLCETCAEACSRNPDLDGLIDKMTEEREGQADAALRIWPLGPRADAELLKKDGFLVRSVLR